MSNFLKNLNGNKMMSTLGNRRQPIFIENIDGQDKKLEERVPLVVEDVSFSQAVTVTNTKNTEINILGKPANILLNGCENIKFSMAGVIGTLEIINSKDIDVNISGRCLGISIDKSNDITLHVPDAISDEEDKSESRKIFTTMCSNIKIQIQFIDSNEYIIPEDLIHESGGGMKFITNWEGECFKTSQCDAYGTPIKVNEIS